MGLSEYLRTSVTLSESESLRTDIEWPMFSAGAGPLWLMGDEHNASVFLYYLCFAIPLVACARLLLTRGRTVVVGSERAFVLGLVVAAALLNWFFLRGSLTARFGDLGVPIAVLGAWVFSTANMRRGSARWVTRAFAILVLIPTAAAIDTIGTVTHELDTTGFSDSVEKIVERVVAVQRDLRALPPPALADPIMSNATVTDYLRACTNPSDRVLLIASAPEVLAMSRRAFAAGQATFAPAFYASEADQRRMLRRLRNQSVPVAVTDREDIYLEDLAPEFPLIHEYLQATFEPAGELLGRAGEPMRILTRRGRVSTRTFGDTSIPCVS